MENFKMTWLLFALFSLPGIQSESMEPMLKVWDSSENVIDDLQDSSQRQRRDKVPHHQDGVVTVTSNVTDTLPWYEVLSCKPRYRFYRPPQPYSHLSLAYLPAVIKVLRCAGGCSIGLHPDLQRCAVTKQEKRRVTIFEFPYLTPITITITHHLECRCDCSIQASDCHPTRQIYRKDYCKCECRDQNPKCNRKIKDWNDKTCMCECKYPPYPCKNSKMVYKTDTCKCECKTKLACPTGFMFNTNTCKCQPALHITKKLPSNQTSTAPQKNVTKKA